MTWRSTCLAWLVPLSSHSTVTLEVFSWSFVTTAWHVRPLLCLISTQLPSWMSPNLLAMLFMDLDAGGAGRLMLLLRAQCSRTQHRVTVVAVELESALRWNKDGLLIRCYKWKEAAITWKGLLEHPGWCAAAVTRRVQLDQSHCVKPVPATQEFIAVTHAQKFRRAFSTWIGHVKMKEAQLLWM